MRLIKGILFDKDGVLVDFDRTWVEVLVDIARHLSNSDILLEDKLLTLAGYDRGMNSFHAGSVWAAGHTRDLVSTWIKHLPGYSEPTLTQFLNEYSLNIQSVALHGADKLQHVFQLCRSYDVRLGIATNDSELSAIKSMKSFGLYNDLSIIIGYDSVKNPKPAADPVNLFCESCDLDSQEVMVIGDNVHDLQMADAGHAGLKVGVLSGNSTRQELQEYADVILESVLELPGYLLSEKLVPV